jgi:ATP-dependent Clp protease ATP-binding subunit ClpA
MFERYTEKARRAIFFSRYESSQYGSPYIETEHLLLGLLRENKSLHRWLPKTTPEAIRRRVDDQSSGRPRTSTSVDLPLSGASKRVLKYAADEADALSHKHIGTEHLFLGLLDETGCLADKLLREAGADPESVRLRLAQSGGQPEESHRRLIQDRDYRSASASFVEIHGVRRNAERIRDAVQRCRMYNLHWEKRSFTNVDIVIARKTGKISFDLALTSDSANFELVKGGWKKDRCFVCRWELFETKDDADHGTGYTNGHDWLCTECYTKFWDRPDLFSSSYSDIT